MNISISNQTQLVCILFLKKYGNLFLLDVIQLLFSIPFKTKSLIQVTPFKAPLSIWGCWQTLLYPAKQSSQHLALLCSEGRI